MSPAKMVKAKRLNVAATIAPVLRAKSAESKKRRVFVTKRETGEVVRVATLAEVQEGVLATARIELDVDDGVRPQSVVCHNPHCGRLINVKQGHGGAVPKYCRGGCRSLRHCVDCKIDIYHQTSIKASRAGRSEVRCKKCSNKLRLREMSPDERRRRASKAHATLTREERSSRSRKGRLSFTKEQRSEIARRGAISRDPQERIQTLAKARSAGHDSIRRMSLDRRRARMKKAQDALRQKREEADRKAWKTRRANAAKKEKSK